MNFARHLVLASLVWVGCTVPTSPPPPLFQVAMSSQPSGVTSLDQVTQVQVTLTLQNAGKGQVQAEFHAPGGSPFQGDVRALSGTPDSQAFEFNLPVAGTVVQSGGLSGTWSVSLLLNDTLLTQQNFELTP